MTTLRHILLTFLLLITVGPAPAEAGPVARATTAEEIPRTWDGPDLPDDWTTRSEIAFRISGHPDDTPILDRLARHGAARLPELAAALGVPIDGGIHVYLAETEAQFRGLQPGNPPMWADATAYPSLRAVFLRHPRLRPGTEERLEQVLDHELVHVLLGQAFLPQATPHWLQEGTAQVLAGQAGPDITRRIARGRFGADLLTLEDLAHGFPADPRRADLAYAQSADFVQWFGATYGDDALPRLVRATARGLTLPRAMQRVTGEPFDAVQERWISRLRVSVPVWSSPETVEAALWGAGGLLLLFGGAWRRLTRRRRLRDWRHADAALDDLARQVIVQRHGALDA